MFEQYTEKAKQQHAPLIEQYAPRLWMKLRITQHPLVSLALRIKNKLTPNALLRYSYTHHP